MEFTRLPLPSIRCQTSVADKHGRSEQRPRGASGNLEQDRACALGPYVRAFRQKFTVLTGHQGA